MFFIGNPRIRFFGYVALNSEQNKKKKKESTQEKEHNQEFSVQNFTITFILFKCPRSIAYFTDFHLFMLS